MSGFDSINKEINNRMHEIACKIAAGDRNLREREELASLMYPKLKYHIWKFCRNDYDTDEALHFTLCKIFNNMDKFRPNAGRFTTWIFTIARNETLYYLDRKHRDIPAYTELSSVFGSLNELHTSSHDPDRYENIQTIYKEAITEIHGIEDDILKNIAIDKMINHDKIKEIAIRYNMNENTVKTKLRKARKDIRVIMVKRNPELEETITEIFRDR